MQHTFIIPMLESMIIYLPLNKLWKGYCNHFCLSLCLSVCLSVCVCLFFCKHDYRRSNDPILLKFGQIMYNHYWKVKFEDELCFPIGFIHASALISPYIKYLCV